MSCPICAEKTNKKYRPFCSKRCADLDLGKWLTGAYAVPSEQDDDADDLAQELQNEAQKTH